MKSGVSVTVHDSRYIYVWVNSDNDRCFYLAQILQSFTAIQALCMVVAQLIRNEIYWMDVEMTHSSWLTGAPLSANNKLAWTYTLHMCTF